MPLSSALFFFFEQDEMGEARAVMRALKEERDEIRSHLDGMQVCVFFFVLIFPCVFYTCVCFVFFHSFFYFETTLVPRIFHERQLCFVPVRTNLYLVPVKELYDTSAYS